VIVLLGANSSFASTSCSYGHCHGSYEAQPTTTTEEAPVATDRSLSLVQIAQVRSKASWDDEQHSATALEMMQGSSAVNGTRPTQKPSVAYGNISVPGDELRTRRIDDTSASVEERQASWHLWLPSPKNKTPALAEMGTRAMQVAQAQITSMRLMFRLTFQESAARRTMGPWAWAGPLAMVLVFVLVVTIMTSGFGKHQDFLDSPDESGCIRPHDVVNVPCPSAKFSPLASHACLLGGSCVPPGSAMLGVVDQPIKQLSEQSLSPAESYNVKSWADNWGKNFPLGSRPNSQRFPAVPESNPPVAAAASAPMIVQSSKVDIMDFLCPDFVVPASCECNLRVPAKAVKGSSFDVTELDGQKVMQINFQKQGGQQLIVLTSKSGDVLAQCGPAPDTPGEFHLLRAHGEYFGKLVQGNSRDEYSVRTPSGAELTFRGAAFNVDIVDTWGRLLATTEPEIGSGTSSPGNEACVLRVAPLTDVSLVICGLLIVNHLM